MLAQTMRRRILLTGGSGTDSITTDGALPVGFAGGFGAGGAATAELSCFMSSSTAKKTSATGRIDFQVEQRSHVNAGDCFENYTIPRDTGIDVSVKTKVSLFTKSAAHLKKL